MGRKILIRMVGKFTFENIKGKDEVVSDLLVGVLLNPSEEHLKNVVEGMKSLGWKIRLEERNSE